MEERGRQSGFVIWSAITSYLAWAFRLYLLLIALADKAAKEFMKLKEGEREGVFMGMFFSAGFLS